MPADHSHKCIYFIGRDVSNGLLHSAMERAREGYHLVHNYPTDDEKNTIWEFCKDEECTNKNITPFEVEDQIEILTAANAELINKSRQCYAYVTGVASIRSAMVKGQHKTVKELQKLNETSLQKLCNVYKINWCPSAEEVKKVAWKYET